MESWWCGKPGWKAESSEEIEDTETVHRLHGFMFTSFSSYGRWFGDGFSSENPIDCYMPGPKQDR